MNLKNTYCRKDSPHFDEYCRLVNEQCSNLRWSKVELMLDTCDDSEAVFVTSQAMFDGWFVDSILRSGAYTEFKGTLKLTVECETEHEQHMCEMLLRKMRKQGVQLNVNGGEWIECVVKNINIDCEYRATPETIDVPWDLIDDKWVCFAVNEDGGIYCYSDDYVCIEDGDDRWNCSDGDCCECPLKIDTKGLDWKDTKTMRPKS